MKIGRNDPCHCGSGNKYKKCCAEKDDAARSAVLAAEAAARAAEAAAAEAAEADEEASAAGAPGAARTASPKDRVKPPKPAPARAPTLVRKHAV